MNIFHFFRTFVKNIFYLQTGARSRVGLVDDLEEDGAMEDDTRLIHRVPMPLDSGLVRDPLFLFFTVVNTVGKKKILF